MSRRAIRPAWALTLGLLAATGSGIPAAARPPTQPVPATAPPPAAAAPDADAPSDVSPEERRAIERALGNASPPAPATPPLPSSVASGSSSAGSSGGYALNASVLLDTAAAWFSDQSVLPAGGHDPAGRGFHLRQLEVSLYANADPFLRLDVNIVMGAEGVELEEAYATTLALPGGLQVRAGRFLLPFGRINRRHPHQWAFENAPLVLPRFFGPDGGRGLGVELSWLAPTPWFMQWTFSGHRRAGACCARSWGPPPVAEGDAEASEPSPQGIDGLEDFLYVTNLEQFWTLGDDWSLMWGLSAAVGPGSASSRLRSVVAGTDLLLRWRPAASSRLTWVAWQTEAMWRGRDLGTDHALRDFGGYSQITWRVSRQWAVAGRVDWVRGVDNDPLDPGQSGDRLRGSLDVTFMPTHFTRVRVQGDLDAPPWRGESIWAAIVGLELGVGAHAAHDF